MRQNSKEGMPDVDQDLLESSPDTRFSQRVQAEFEVCLEEQLAVFRRTLEFLKQVGIDQKVEEKRKRESSTDINGKLSYITNNLYFWWPRGHYRSSDFQRNVKPEQKLKREKLIKDIDHIIEQLGFENEEVFTNKNTQDVAERTHRFEVLGKVYFALRDMGYERSDCTS